MLKVGLIGVGGISAAHFSAWDTIPEAEIVAICDVRTERLELHPEKRHYTSFDEMLEKEELDILDICLPSYLHPEYAIKAMEKGLHVLCEKPISLKEEDVERVYSTAHKNNVKFMVAHVLRFWPEFELLKELYDSKKYGKLLSLSMNRLSSIPKWSWDNWMKDEKRSGLVPFDLHIHDLDFLVYAFGKPNNMIGHRSKRPDQDYIQALYEFDDFCVSAQASWFAAPYPFSAGYRAQFETAVLEFQQGICKIYEVGGNVIDLTGAADGDTGSINLPKSNAYANEVRYFMDCVLEDRFPDKVKPEELTTVIELLHNL
ncbi:MAG: Gfo/Idh/MocA family oxidoreductase [Lachnospiraceae bacterium]|nr:Gfo/Idh/MocA family oxidoreductase [Lachnospiraceae bacterium]